MFFPRQFYGVTIYAELDPTFNHIAIAPGKDPHRTFSSIPELQISSIAQENWHERESTVQKSREDQEIQNAQMD